MERNINVTDAHLVEAFDRIRPILRANVEALGATPGGIELAMLGLELGELAVDVLDNDAATVATIGAAVAVAAFALGALTVGLPLAERLAIVDPIIDTLRAQLHP